ncbi:MAG: VWA domain-containing protein [Planctomycetota bacterium]|nr:VWA domain-containing protein [Planctomycetota bacterium]
MTRPIDSLKLPPNFAFAQADASVALANGTAFDALMAWMAEYIPTWGTSVAIHVAVVLLGAFIVWQNVPPPVLGEYVITARPIRPVPEVEKRDTKEMQDARLSSRGKMTPRRSTFVFRPMESEIQGITQVGVRMPIDVIGTGPGTRGDGKDGLDLDGPRIFNRMRGIDGIPFEAAKVVYLVDRSGSMTDSLEIVKYELKRSIGELDEESEFHVIFYSTGPVVEMPTRRLVHATERNKQMAFEFIDLVIAMGGTDPSQAIERAFAVKPDLVYLLTDGEFDRAVADLVKRRNADGRVKVCTIGFLYHPKDPVLVDIAERNGGQYKFISEADLAAMIGG